MIEAVIKVLGGPKRIFTYWNVLQTSQVWEWLTYRTVTDCDTCFPSLCSSSFSFFLQLELKYHSFFSPINWEDLMAKKITPPFVPSVVCITHNLIRMMCCPRTRLSQYHFHVSLHDYSELHQCNINWKCMSGFNHNCTKALKRTVTQYLQYYCVCFIDICWKSKAFLLME